jgi:hypothetical protein
MQAPSDAAINDRPSSGSNRWGALAMPGAPSPFDALVADSRSLESRAQKVQGAEELLAGEEELGALADDYQAWLARALEILPSEFHEAFRFEYAGDWAHRIKHFLCNRAHDRRGPCLNPRRLAL